MVITDKNLYNLKEKLQSELVKEDINFQTIATLSRELLDTDENSVRFSIDARHIHRLGFELVGKQETALAELIKNAYDADATEVYVNFEDYSSPGGTLTVKDNGHGMTEHDMRNGWMRLSTDDKERNPISPHFGRSRAGRKGIGRFAVERLGTQLTLETCVKGDGTGIRVEFDWDNDFQHGLDLTMLFHRIQKFKKIKMTQEPL